MRGCHLLRNEGIRLRALLCYEISSAGTVSIEKLPTFVSAAAYRRSAPRQPKSGDVGEPTAVTRRSLRATPRFFRSLALDSYILILIYLCKRRFWKLRPPAVG